MNSYYTNTLYPLQDKVLRSIQQLHLPFYLTGGTALSRGYFHHRYSDDLDLFVNTHPDFPSLSRQIISQLGPLGLSITSQSAHYFSLMVSDTLKVELVNDIGKQLHPPVKKSFFNQVDTWQNILANKLTALIGRDDPKDVVDVWIIATHQTVDWPYFFEAANSKAVGIFPPTIAQKLHSFPPKLLNSIKWVPGKMPDKADFHKNIQTLVKQILALP